MVSLKTKFAIFKISFSSNKIGEQYALLKIILQYL
uniref:Uncharacterized protein n=1 Tax=virus sp. ctiha2 TaxID=2827299 RepID=A0A8S5RHB2_9VIRU|nr:MAG TPA: hypothetical protein [virus sp. ctiha2]DAZ51578.1 MAG TPA: hypothetical protein [Caudoviricetes sp.]